MSNHLTTVLYYISEAGKSLLSMMQAALLCLKSSSLYSEIIGGTYYVKINSSCFQPGGYSSIDVCLQPGQYLNSGCGQAANENTHSIWSNAYSTTDPIWIARWAESLKLRHFAVPISYLVGKFDQFDGVALPWFHRGAGGGRG